MNIPEERIVFAGGGSGGTVAPGIAIAQRLARIAPEVRTLFLCSDRPVDTAMLSAASMEFHPMPARVPSRTPRGMYRFAGAWLATRSRARPYLAPGTRVVALGGFVAPPVVSEARAMGVEVTLLNLDRVAGRANRWISRRATTRLTSVLCNLSNAGNPLGVPLRREVLATVPPAESRQRLGLDPERQTLLVTGASQGAQSLNAFMLAFLQRNTRDLADWQVVHLTGDPVERDHLRGAYLKAGVPAQVLAFLDEMGDAWGAADLALSRGGASSIAEIAANDVPALVAPYPWHADRHQAKNAGDLIDAGGVRLVEDTIEPTSNLESIGKPLAELLGDIATLTAMREALQSRPHPDAADVVARRILGIS